MPLSTLGSATSRAFGFKGLSAFTNWFGKSSNATVAFAPLAISSSGYLYAGFNSSGTASLIRLDKSGLIQLQKKLSGLTGQSRFHVIDSSDNAYGIFSGGIYKYDSTGVLQWQKTLSVGGSTVDATGIALDSSGNPHIVGAYYTGTYTRGVVAKMTTAGAITWQRYATQATTSNDGLWLNAISVDSSGNVYVAGETVSSTGTVYGGVVAKYNSSGAIQWQRKQTDSPTSRSVTPNGIAVDTSGNVYCSFGDLVGNTSTHLLKYNTSGSIQWQRKLNNCTTGSRCFIYNNTDIYVTGFESAGIAKYNSSGAIQWQRKVDASGLQTLWGICVDGENYYFSTRGNTLAKLPIDGSKTGTYGVYTYSVSTRTEAAGTLADAAGSFTDAAGGITVGTATGTDAVDNQTLTLTGVS